MNILINKVKVIALITLMIIGTFSCKNENRTFEILTKLKNVNQIIIISNGNNGSSDTLYFTKSNDEIIKTLGLFKPGGAHNSLSDTVSREINRIVGTILIDYDNNKKLKVNYGVKSYMLYTNNDTIKDVFTKRLSEFLGGLNYCNPYMKKIKSIQIDGIVISKCQNSDSLGGSGVKLRANNEKDKLISLPLFDESHLYDFVQPNDSLIKLKGSLEFKVIRKDSTRIFKVRCY